MVTGPRPCHSANWIGFVVERTFNDHSPGSSWSEHTATAGLLCPASCHALTVCASRSSVGTNTSTRPWAQAASPPPPP